MPIAGRYIVLATGMMLKIISRILTKAIYGSFLHIILQKIHQDLLKGRPID
jgi:hypothetical protein